MQCVFVIYRVYLLTVELERVYLYSVRKGQTAVARDRGLYELEKSRRRLYIVYSRYAP